MGRRLRNKLPMMEGLLQPVSNNQQEISRYLERTKESQKKYHDRHASKDMKELQPGTKVRMQPWTNSSHCSQASPYTKILRGAGWRRQKVSRQQATSTGMPSTRTWQFEWSRQNSNPGQRNSQGCWVWPTHDSHYVAWNPIPGATHIPGTSSGEHYGTICHPKWQTSSSTKPAWPVGLYNYRLWSVVDLFSLNQGQWHLFSEYYFIIVLLFKKGRMWYKMQKVYFPLPSQSQCMSRD